MTTERERQEARTRDHTSCWRIDTILAAKAGRKKGRGNEWDPLGSAGRELSWEGPSSLRSETERDD